MFRRQLTVAHLACAALTFGLSTACSGNGPVPDAPNGTAAKPADSGEKPKPDPEPAPAKADLSTDEAVRAAYQKATGKEFHEDDCIGRPGVKDVIVLGSFAHDRGCDVDGAFIGGAYVDEDKLVTDGLGMVGWKEMSADERPAFALTWAEKVLFHWGGDFVSETEQAFEFGDTPAFTAPEAKVEGDEVVVTAWIDQPPGMQDVDAFDQVELRFSADGAVSRAVKSQFSVDGARTR